MISVPTAKGEKKMRLIDADAFEVVTAQGVSMDFADGMQYVLEMLDKAPTIEAEPVRRGKYVLLYDTYGPMVCSECGGEAPSISMGSEYEESQYCPSCGAKMDGKEPDDR